MIRRGRTSTNVVPELLPVALLALGRAELLDRANFGGSVLVRISRPFSTTKELADALQHLSCWIHFLVLPKSNLRMLPNEETSLSQDMQMNHLGQ